MNRKLNFMIRKKLNFKKKNKYNKIIQNSQIMKYKYYIKKNNN